MLYLVTMSVYMIGGNEEKITIASISTSDSKVRECRIENGNCNGQMSKSYADLVLYLTNYAGCKSKTYKCEVYYINKKGSVDKVEKTATHPVEDKGRYSILLLNLKVNHPSIFVCVFPFFFLLTMCLAILF